MNNNNKQQTSTEPECTIKPVTFSVSYIFHSFLNGFLFLSFIYFFIHGAKTVTLPTIKTDSQYSWASYYISGLAFVRIFLFKMFHYYYYYFQFPSVFCEKSQTEVAVAKKWRRKKESADFLLKIYFRFIFVFCCCFVIIIMLCSILTASH